MPLCTVCKSLPPLKDLLGFRHRTYGELQSPSTRHQCDFCAIIWESLEKLGSTELILAKEPDAVTVILDYQWQGGGIGAHVAHSVILVGPDIPEPAGSLLEIFTMRGEQHYSAIPKRNTAPSHKSPSTYDFIREAIQDCLNNHVQCSKNTDVELPTFLVDAGASLEEENVRIVRNDATDKGKYLALSYCWGGPQALSLTTKTLGLLRDGVATSSLPRTLRDALNVTRELGHRYIWIDALCIIQDDEVFKQHELQRMNSIYQNAFLTIQPSYSASVNHGFLDRRKPIPHVKLVFQQNDDGTQSHIYARSITGKSRSMVGTSTGDRAWTFQETALSMRLIDFDDRQVTVGCRQDMKLEVGGRHPNYSSGPGFHKIVRPDIYASVPFDRAILCTKALSAWYVLVGAYYSGRLYTVSKDRIYALSAFAEEAHALIGGEYLAGLWSTDLVRGLCWRSRGTKILTRAAQYRAPSWSWAALDGPIAWHDNERHKGGLEAIAQPRVIDAWAKPEGIHRYGACLDGRLILQTLVGTASLMRAVSVNRWGGFTMTTLDGQQKLCGARFDTVEQPETFTCAFLSVGYGLLLITHDDSFRRVGTFWLEASFIRTNGADGYQTWMGTCKNRTVAIV